MIRILLENRPISEASEIIDFESRSSNMVLDILKMMSNLTSKDKKKWIVYTINSHITQRAVIFSPSTIANWIKNIDVLDSDSTLTGVTTPHKTFNHPKGLEFNDLDKPAKFATFSTPEEAGKLISKMLGGVNSKLVTLVAAIDASGKMVVGRGKQAKSKELYLDDKTGCENNPDAISTAVKKLMSGFYEYDGI